MNSFLKPIQLGKLQLPGNIFYSPLAGCSDYPFRLISSRYRPDLMFCEMVKMDALVRLDPGSFHILDYHPSMRPIGAQLCGSKVAIAGQAAKIVEDLGFDVVDLNCGCPVDKVTKDGSGSGLLKDPRRIGDLISTIVAAVSIPVTVKIRIGWDDENLNAEEITEIAEQAGASLIFVHGRTRQQGYKGKAHLDPIRRCKERAKKIPVIGNGDVFSPEAALNMFEQTGCDGVLASRGTMGQPWIAQEIRDYFQGKPVFEKSMEFLRQALLAHFEAVLAYHPDRRAILEMRKIGCWYFKSETNARAFRHCISRAESVEEIRRLISEYDPAQDGPDSPNSSASSPRADTCEEC
ncbi:MAG: dusB [Chlamydiales bacterium]|jgi:nifR3 family TIM-barrel protein|nr:dusB [Chlamydiales bacterium]